MGSPITNYYRLLMEVFEKRDLDMAPYKPEMYKRYVDDKLLVWSHSIIDVQRGWGDSPRHPLLGGIFPPQLHPRVGDKEYALQGEKGL